MPDDGDILEIGGRRMRGPARDARPEDAWDDEGARNRFLSVWFRCCHVYGRMQRDPRRSAYVGRCPRCGAAVRATIGEGGTRQRVFEAG